MITGQLLIYRFNDLQNAKAGADRNLYTLRDVNVSVPSEFRHAVQDALDEVPPGRGYVLIKWNGKIYIAEKDVNNPAVDYVRHPIQYHPLADKFTI